MALKEINLIPEEWMTKALYARHLKVTALIFLLIQGIIWSSILTYMGRGSSSEPDRIYALSGEIGALRKEIRSIEERLELFSKENQSIGELTRVFPLWTIITELSTAIPPPVWMNEISLSSNPEEKGKTASQPVLSLKGNAFSHGDIGNFLNILSRNPVYEKVRLSYALEETFSPKNETGPPQKPPIRFQIDISIGKVIQ